ncbi:MAG: lipase family protein [Selenomonas sp.]|nr:lipase family protein [Selenomonas sp.]
MKVLHFVILLCVLAFPLRAFAAAPNLPALLFVEAAASEAAYSGELSELLRARLTAAGWEIVGAETVGHRGTVGRFFHMVRRDADGAELHLIAFPGTERGSDIWTDLRMKRAAFGGHAPAEFLAVRDTPKEERGGMPLVHRGFLDYCQAALFTDAVEGETAGECLAADLRAHPSEKLYLTGHSLGGAAAILAAARLSDLGVSPDQLIVTTFGAPAVGNEDFVRTYQDRFTLRRVVMRGDPVKDALPSPLGFHHFGERIDWQPARTTAAFPHTMTVYVDAALRRLYDTHDSSGLTFLVGQENRTAGHTVYLTPIVVEVDDALAEDVPYLRAVLRDAQYVRNAATVFAPADTSGPLDVTAQARAARTVGAEQMLVYRISGEKLRDAHETYRLTLERSVYDRDGNLLAAGACSAATGALTPMEVILYLFAQD